VTRRRSRYLLYACLVAVFGPSLFLSWRTYQLADRITSIESFDAEVAAGCPAVDRALAATWSDASARQLADDQRDACVDASRAAGVGGTAPADQRAAAPPCTASDDEDGIGDTFGVLAGRLDDACGLRDTALMTFKTTLGLTLLAAALAAMTLRTEF
jgi:hypothetical protein